MYTESATRYRTVTLKDVTGRSASMTTCELAGVTSVNHGDAASWRRKVVYAWMSTVRPSIETRTGCGVPESAVTVGCWPGTPAMPVPTDLIPVTQVYGGSAFVTWSSTCGQM